MESVLPRMSPVLLMRLLTPRSQRPRQRHEPLAGAFSANALDQQALQAYRAAFGFLGAHVPLAYYFLIAQRAQVGMMATPAFRHRAAGLIHVENTMRLHRPVDALRPFDVRIELLEEPAAGSADGLVFNTVIEQDKRARVRCTSRYIAPGRGWQAGQPTSPRRPVAVALPEAAHWNLAPNSGLAYAALSGDYNPIHLWRWSARLFGQPQPIIHGMHGFARATAFLEQILRSPIAAGSVNFFKPIHIGSDARLGFDKQSGRFEIHSPLGLAMRGRVSLQEELAAAVA